MSVKQGVTAVCRALSIYFLIWFLDALTYIPSDLYSFFHYGIAPITSGEVYLRNYHLISVGFRLLRMVILFFAVQWFYRAGPKLQAYFLAPSEADDQPRTS